MALIQITLAITLVFALDLFFPLIKAKIGLELAKRRLRRVTKKYKKETQINMAELPQELKIFLDEGGKGNWGVSLDAMVIYLRKVEAESGTAGELLSFWVQQGLLKPSLMLQLLNLAKNPEMEYKLKDDLA